LKVEAMGMRSVGISGIGIPRLKHNYNNIGISRIKQE
jgi:hypothetical protein